MLQIALPLILAATSLVASVPALAQIKPKTAGKASFKKPDRSKA